MDKKVKQYFQLVSEIELGGYRVKTVFQERKEYDDIKLYEALPDPEVWRMLSKADSSKVASLIKLSDQAKCHFGR
ncbi:hypothetical protein D3C73_630840 [compost metagenome]